MKAILRPTDNSQLEVELDFLVIKNLSPSNVSAGAARFTEDGHEVQNALAEAAGVVNPQWKRHGFQVGSAQTFEWVTTLINVLNALRDLDPEHHLEVHVASPSSGPAIHYRLYEPGFYDLKAWLLWLGLSDK